MDDSEARANLDRLILDSGEEYAAISRLIGRNPAYIQQYVKRGSPRRLAESDRRAIAQFFSVDERLLGAPEEGQATGMAEIARLDVGAAAGHGMANASEVVVGRIALDQRWLAQKGWPPARLSTIRVEGDSMEPTLSAGDEIMVLRSEAGATALPRRDGLYVLRMEGDLLVKRVARAPGGKLSVTSDNPAYPGWPALDPQAVEIIGRVVWMARVVG